MAAARMNTRHRSPAMKPYSSSSRSDAAWLRLSLGGRGTRGAVGSTGGDSTALSMGAMSDLIGLGLDFALAGSVGLAAV